MRPCSWFRIRWAEHLPPRASRRFVRPLPLAGVVAGDGRISQVPVGPRCMHALFFDPGGCEWLACNAIRLLPSAFNTASAPTH